ncbi:interferon-induced transmembrane protein 3-like [Parus major]|uniref:interferon-induced transmembrane protein 3-like n=1 Tax=Parus major TaxID=9157 RepID=UPI001443C1D2|nr:interferon-induced transmembrane protein 3-like [Parus major]
MQTTRKAGPGLSPPRRRSLPCPYRGVRRGGLFPLRPKSLRNETTAAPSPQCLHLPSHHHAFPRCRRQCPREPGMQQQLPPYEVLSTEVNMEEMPRSTTVLMEEPPRPPRDHLVWSFFTTLYGNFCCLGLLAFVFSVKSRDRKGLGDYSGALSYGSTAKYLNITALVINIIIIIIVVTVVAVSVAKATNSPHQYGYNPFSGHT